MTRHIAWQLVSAGTSIAANYEEAKAAYSRRDFTSKSSIVLKEARESRLWLRVLAAENLAPIDEVRPLLGFRYRTRTSLGVLGTLVTEDRHGYLEPLEVSTLEFTRPVEYGMQWREDRRQVGGEVFIDWQHLNTRNSHNNA